MIHDVIERIAVIHRPDAGGDVLAWKDRVYGFVTSHFPKASITNPEDAQVVIVLGGDGSILEVAKRYSENNPLIFGLNMGHVGFLASVRNEVDFEAGISKLLTGHFHVSKRSMIRTSLIRRGVTLCTTECLNDVFVKSLAGMCELSISIDGTDVQRVRGTGVLVSTPTGSTAFNLSAHGPIIMPTIRCMAMTELLDHDIPTPSVIVDGDQELRIKILSFRKSNTFVLKNNNEPVDVILSADSADVYPLEVEDEVLVSMSDKTVSIVELEDGYFVKSLREKFSFK
jgi:NAD+ kinase